MLEAIDSLNSAEYSEKQPDHYLFRAIFGMVRGQLCKGA